MQAKISRNAEEISRNMVGTRQIILVEGPDRKGSGRLAGRTENNRVVNFDCNNSNLVRQFVEVEIVDSLPNSLLGRLANPIAQSA